MTVFIRPCASITTESGELPRSLLAVLPPTQAVHQLAAVLVPFACGEPDVLSAAAAATSPVTEKIRQPFSAAAGAVFDGIQVTRLGVLS